MIRRTRRLALAAVLLIAALSGTNSSAAQTPEEAAQAWVATLVSEFVDAEQYAQASAELEALGQAAVPELLKHLGEDRLEARLAVLGVLTRLGPAAAGGLSQYRELLYHDHAGIRTAATRLVAALGPAAAPLRRDLLVQLEDPDEISASWAARALLGLEPDYAVKQLERLLTEFDVQPVNVELLSLSQLVCYLSTQPAGSALRRELRRFAVVVRFNHLSEIPVGEALAGGPPGEVP